MVSQLGAQQVSRSLSWAECEFWLGPSSAHKPGLPRSTRTCDSFDLRDIWSFEKCLIHLRTATHNVYSNTQKRTRTDTSKAWLFTSVSIYNGFHQTHWLNRTLASPAITKNTHLHNSALRRDIKQHEKIHRGSPVNICVKSDLLKHLAHVEVRCWSRTNSGARVLRGLMTPILSLRCAWVKRKENLISKF